VELLHKGPRPNFPVPPPAPEHILICGWRPAGVRQLIGLYDEMCPPGTVVHLLCELSVEARVAALQDMGVDFDALENVRVGQSVHHGFQASKF
jgi:hypothetical protein